jgi:hypothetical protein
MIKKVIISSFIFLPLLLNCNISFAQTAPHEVVINAGTGYSLIAGGDDFLVLTSSVSYNTIYAPHTPEFGITIDYGVLKWLSLGIGISYQEVEETAYLNANTFLFSAIYSRINTGLRLLAHLNKKHKDIFDNYIGLRPGISYWNFQGAGSSIWVSIQVIYGIRYYFSKVFGIHCEAGLGTPYLLEGGVTFRLGYHKPAEEPAVSK